MSLHPDATVRHTRVLATLVVLSILPMFLPPATSDLHGEVRPLTLYEKTGRGPVVAWAEIKFAEHTRFAEVKMLDLIKCAIPECPGPEFRIAYKLDSFLRQPWQDKITFADGERVLLFLRKFTREDGEKPEGDIYTLMWGAQGRVTLPPEGERAWVEAVRTFKEILATGDPEHQAVMLREHLPSTNPILSDASFEEMLKQGLGTLEMIPELIRYFDSPREPARLGAMRLLQQVISDAQAAGRAVPGQQDLADLVRGRAVSDKSPDFRVEAVKVLGILGGAEVRAFLQRLAKEDPSQLVRYEAEKALTGAPAP